MSSGLMLNGGTAENFIINSGGSSVTVATRRNSASPEASHYDSWQPEDLVATVQFLATLDAERMPYVLPEELRALDPCNPHPSSPLAASSGDADQSGADTWQQPRQLD